MKNAIAYDEAWPTDTYAIACSRCDSPGPGDGGAVAATHAGWQNTGTLTHPSWVCPVCSMTPPAPEPHASWWQQSADERGFPVAFMHASGALLERVAPCRWQLVFGGKHRTMTGRFAPLDRANRALPELAGDVLQATQQA